MLRNPNSTFFHGISLPNNVYEIKKRVIIPQAVSTDVQVFLVCYTDETETEAILESDYTLTGLPTDPSVLVPSLYQSELIIQFGDVNLDGTNIEDFEVL